MQKYNCTQCAKTFSRKWNALRHNNQTHHGLAIIFDRTSGWVYRKNQELDMSTLPDPQNDMVIDQAILDILGKMLKPLSELETELVSIPEHARTDYIGTLLTGALITSDPVKVIQDAVDFNRSIKGKMKIVFYVSKKLGISDVQADGYITNSIKTSRFYKNYTAINKGN